jgi:hypothetical protein
MPLNYIKLKRDNISSFIQFENVLIISTFIGNILVVDCS